MLKEKNFAKEMEPITFYEALLRLQDGKNPPPLLTSVVPEVKEILDQTRFRTKQYLSRLLDRILKNEEKGHVGPVPIMFSMADKKPLLDNLIFAAWTLYEFYEHKCCYCGIEGSFSVNDIDGLAILRLMPGSKDENALYFNGLLYCYSGDETIDEYRQRIVEQYRIACRVCTHNLWEHLEKDRLFLLRTLAKGYLPIKPAPVTDNDIREYAVHLAQNLSVDLECYEDLRTRLYNFLRDNMNPDDCFICPVSDFASLSIGHNTYHFKPVLLRYRCYENTYDALKNNRVIFAMPYVRKALQCMRRYKRYREDDVLAFKTLKAYVARIKDMWAE